MKRLDAPAFLPAAEQLPLIDVRAPREFDKGHLPGAINIPLFTDAEHSAVGTTYKQSGKQTAMLVGWNVANPKREALVGQVRELAPDGKLALYCWRGGLRSAKFAEMLEEHGLDCSLLDGGYKAYRAHLRERLANLPTLIVLAGATGSGKTDTLHALAAEGEQIVDLEGIAHHRGSAFGSLGLPEQPGTAQFQARVFEAVRRLDPARHIWVESESKTIGKVYLPEDLWESMNRARLLTLQVPMPVRVRRLLQDYGDFPRDELATCVKRIERRWGGNNVKDCLERLAAGDIAGAAERLLGYYDRAYQASRTRYKLQPEQVVEAEGEDPARWARQLIARAAEPWDPGAATS